MAGQQLPPEREPERSIRRALLASSARLFRLARAGMAVVAVGYESEARAFDRGMIETRARWVQVRADSSGSLASRWLKDGKLPGTMTAAIRSSLPTAEPAETRTLYRTLSGDVHPDLAQFMRSLVREKHGGGYEMGFSAHRTPLADRSLLLYAWLCAEATGEVGERVGITVPHLPALHEALVGAGARLRHRR